MDSTEREQYEAEITRLRLRADKRTDQIIELQAAIKDVYKIIEPFVKAAKIWNSATDISYSIIHYVVGGEEISVTIADFRAAAEWIKEHNQTEI